MTHNDGGEGGGGGQNPDFRMMALTDSPKDAYVTGYKQNPITEVPSLRSCCMITCTIFCKLDIALKALPLALPEHLPSLCIHNLVRPSTRIGFRVKITVS